MAHNQLGMDALGCKEQWPKPQGLLIHKKPEAAGSVLVWLPNYAIGNTGSLSPVCHVWCVGLLFIFLLMVTVTAKAPRYLVCVQDKKKGEEAELGAFLFHL